MSKKRYSRAAPQKSSGAKTVIKVIALLLLLLILVLVVAYAVLTNGFSQYEFITKNDKRIGTSTTIALSSETEFELEDFSLFNGSNENITVKIYANADKDFSFTAGGNPYRYKGVGELTDCFEIETKSKSFKVSVKDGCKTMRDMLSVKYGEDIEPISEDWKNANYFIMQIETDTATYNVAFGIVGFDSGNIRVILDKTEIVF